MCETHHSRECMWMIVVAEYYWLVNLWRYTAEEETKERGSDHQKSLGLHLVEVQSRSLNGAGRRHLGKVLGNSLPTARGRHSDWTLGPVGGVRGRQRALKGLLHLIITGTGTARALCYVGDWVTPCYVTPQQVVYTLEECVWKLLHPNEVTVSHRVDEECAAIGIHTINQQTAEDRERGLLTN